MGVHADVLTVSQSVYISRRLDKGNMVTTAHPRKRDVAVGVATVCAIAMLGFVSTVAYARFVLRGDIIE